MSSTKRTEIDFATIDRLGLSGIDRVLDAYAPGWKKKGSEYTFLNPSRADKRLGSFKFNSKTGVFCDFATNQRGKGTVALIASLKGLTQGAAAKELCNFLNIPISDGLDGLDGLKQRKPRQPGNSRTCAIQTNSGLDMVCLVWNPIPDNAPPPPDNHYDLGNVGQRWTYRDENGKALKFNCRFNLTDSDKQFRPLTYSAGQWGWKDLETPRPIYNLDKLASKPRAVVLICEGEKAADAAAELFPDCVTTTTGSATSADGADLSQLGGREIIVWPDADDAGNKYASALIERLTPIASSIRQVDLAELAKVTKLTAGFDAADYVAAGLQSDKIRFVDVPRQFLTKGDSIYLVSIKRDANDTPKEKLTWLMSGVTVLGRARDRESKQWGLALAITDPKNIKHIWVMPNNMLAGDGINLIAELLDLGANLAAGKDNRRNQVLYFQTIKPEKFAKHVATTGWQGQCFVLPNQVIGTSADGEAVYLQTPGAVPDIGLAVSSTLAEWQVNIAKYAVGNSRMILTICINLSGPLLKLTGDEGGGVNLHSGSTAGKTTIARCGGSVHGGHRFVLTMRSTHNGLEGQFLLHNDLCQTCDELGEAPPDDLGAIVYMLTNGRTKARAGRNGAARAVEQFQLAFLTTGEHKFTDYLARAGLKSAAGQELRLIDFPADAGKGLGVFEGLHNFDSAEAFAEHLNIATNQYYGSAGMDFLKRLAESDWDKIRQGIKLIRDDWQSKFVPPGASAQIKRVARRFSLYAAAGELATSWNITGWAPGTAFAAIGQCFQDWLAVRGNVDSIEKEKVLSQVRLFFEQHGQSRFAIISNDEDDQAKTVINRAGWRNPGPPETEFWVLPEMLKNEILKGLNRDFSLTVLEDEGWLKKGKTRRDQSKHVPGLKTNHRVYVFSLAVYDEVTADEEEAELRANANAKDSRPQFQTSQTKPNRHMV